MSNRPKSAAAFERAQSVIAGGVNSPVRALRSVGEQPLFVRDAAGSHFTDIDGNQYIDLCMSWGALILGHAAPDVVDAATLAIARGSSYGIPTEQETGLAERVRAAVPSMERLRFVNSGTEATMSAIRVARGYTGRDVLVKFSGCYHGHADHLLVEAGSAVAGLQQASSAGVPRDFVRQTVCLPYGDVAQLEQYFSEHGHEVAALILEPVACNMGVVVPSQQFLEATRRVARQSGALLIWDEVITGFRLSRGGAQELFSITPDLTTVGKIVGGGFPAAAFGGRADIMAVLAPDGPVYQAGTLSGNPVAMAAGMATLNLLARENFYHNLEAKAEWFYGELRQLTKGRGVQLAAIGSMFTLFFSDTPVTNFIDAKNCNLQRFARYFRSMFSHGIYVSPSQFEGNFISAAHTRSDLERVLEAVEQTINNI